MQSPRYETIRHLLQPSSIAVVGASDNPDRIGGRPQRILEERGFKGAIYPVNPKYETVQGLRCYRDVASLPDGVDLVIICVPAGAVVDAVEQSAAKGAKAAVIFAGGFAETGGEGAEMQARINEIAAKSGIALVGPNSLGLASFVNKSYATFATTLSTLPQIEAGQVALVSQSGGTAFNVLTEGHWAGARFSHVIATGNEAGLRFAEYLRYLARDEATASVIGYVEGVEDGAEFATALAELRAAGKPTFLLKAGASERGSRSVESHTAQFSGDDSAFDAIFQRYGVIRLRTMDDAVDVARALTITSPGDGIAVATNSGGAVAYLSDVCDRYDVPLADLSERTLSELREALPSFAGLTNPVDFTPQIIGDNTLLARTLRILDRDPSIDTLLIFLGSMEYLGDALTEVVKDVQDELSSPVILTWLGVSDHVRVAAADAGLMTSADPARVLRGIGLARAGRAASTSSPGPGTGDAPPPTGDVALPAPEAGGVDEERAMAILEAFGQPVPAHVVVSSREELGAATERTGFPVVLKLIEPFLAHRMKAGGVALDLADPEALGRAYDTMVHELGMTRGLVASHIPEGVDLIAGVLADRTFGSRAVIGSGGVWANEIADTRALVPSYSADYIEQELRQLRLLAAIEQSAIPLPGIAEALSSLLTTLDLLVQSHGFAEIECNPVRVTGGGVVILDALAFGGGDR